MVTARERTSEANAGCMLDRLLLVYCIACRQAVSGGARRLLLYCCINGIQISRQTATWSRLDGYVGAIM